MNHSDYEGIKNNTILFFFERLSKGQPRTLHDLSCQFGTKGFTKEMRNIAGGSQSGLKQFLTRYPAIFCIEGNDVYLTADRASKTSDLVRDRNYVQEAVAYFREKLKMYGSAEVPIRSLMGHRSQASLEVRHVSGQSAKEFKDFLASRPEFVIVQGNYVVLREVYDSKETLTRFEEEAPIVDPYLTQRLVLALEQMVLHSMSQIMMVDDLFHQMKNSQDPTVSKLVSSTGDLVTLLKMNCNSFCVQGCNVTLQPMRRDQLISNVTPTLIQSPPPPSPYGQNMHQRVQPPPSTYTKVTPVTPFPPTITSSSMNGLNTSSRPTFSSNIRKNNSNNNNITPALRSSPILPTPIQGPSDHFKLAFKKIPLNGHPVPTLLTDSGEAISPVTTAGQTTPATTNTAPSAKEEPAPSVWTASLMPTKNLKSQSVDISKYEASLVNPKVIVVDKMDVLLKEVISIIKTCKVVSMFVMNPTPYSMGIICIATDTGKILICDGLRKRFFIFTLKQLMESEAVIKVMWEPKGLNKIFVQENIMRIKNFIDIKFVKGKDQGDTPSLELDQMMGLYGFPKVVVSHVQTGQPMYIGDMAHYWPDKAIQYYGAVNALIVLDMFEVLMQRLDESKIKYLQQQTQRGIDASWDSLTGKVSSGRSSSGGSDRYDVRRNQSMWGLELNNVEVVGRAKIIIEKGDAVEICAKIFQDPNPVVAIDLEGVSLGRGGFITLLQMATMDGEVFLFDIHTNSELMTILKELIESPNVVKVMHACCGDVAAMHHHFQIEPRNIFDTQCAYSVVHQQRSGQEAVNLSCSLKTLVDEFGDGEIDMMNKENMKKIYRKNPAFWANRPMTNEMVDYAASDVITLVPSIYIKLKDMIQPEYLPLMNELVEENVLTGVDPEKAKFVKKHRKQAMEVEILKGKLFKIGQDPGLRVSVLSNREIRLLRYVAGVTEQELSLVSPYASFELPCMRIDGRNTRETILIVRDKQEMDVARDRKLRKKRKANPNQMEGPETFSNDDQDQGMGSLPSSSQEYHLALDNLIDHDWI